MVSARVGRILTEAMLKHLPPSASRLSVLDVNGRAEEILRKQRPDLQITSVGEMPWNVSPGSFDAITAFDDDLRGDLLAAALDALRPGGRLIVMATQGDPNETQVRTLEQHGFTRILVEAGAECPLPVGVLMRGEKPHVAPDTHARVRVAADQDEDALTLDQYRGRFVHLLVRQSPNKPAWAIRADEPVTWEAITLDDDLLAFTSLPKAVAFMQPAVLAGAIRDVTKVAKFAKETVREWTHPLRLNPPPHTTSTGVAFGALPIDPSTAEAADE
jgi:hypothetical protein